MATKVFSSARTDPRYLLKKSVRLMAKTLTQLNAAAERKDVRSETGALLSAGGLTDKEITSLIGLSRALHALARQADADDVARYRQMKGMTDEQLEEQERRLKAAAHSEAIKEGLRAKALEEEVPMEEYEDGED